MKIEWRRRPFFYFSFILCGLIPLWSFLPVPKFPKKPTDKGVESLIQKEPAPLFLGGKIVSEVQQRQTFGEDTKNYFIFEVERVWSDLDHEGDLIKGKVRVSWKNAPKYLDYGNSLVLEGELDEFPGKRNPGGFDSKSYWNRHHVQAAFFADAMSRYRILERKPGNPLIQTAIRIRQTLSKKISWDFSPRDAAFLKALYLGEKSDLDQDFKDLFLKTGTMHLLAVSGFNIGFLMTALLLFIKPFPVPGNIRLGFLLISIWVYCFIVGWQAPVARATLMATVFLLAELIGRKSDGLNTLGLAACIILLIDPNQVYDVGFQLSFVAVLGLMTVVPVFLKKPLFLPNEKKNLWEKSRDWSEDLFWVSFVSLFTTLPLTVQNFYIVTPYALAANLLLVPLTFLLFLFGVPYLFISFFAPKALVTVTIPMKVIMAWCIKILFFMENLPYAVWVTGKLTWWLWAVLTVGLLFIFFSPYFKTRAARAFALILFCMNLFVIQEIYLHFSRKFEMTMLDVGQGDSIYFEFPKGANLLVDAGGARFSDKGRWVLEPFLRYKGVRSLDAVLISHPQEDHVGGLMTVLEDFKVKRVFHAGFSYDSPRWHEIEQAIEKEKSLMLKVGRGREIIGYPGTRILICHPQLEAEEDSNINNESIVLKLIYGDVSFLMTGDIEKEAMESILLSGQDISADILKVPHHGSKTNLPSKDFFDAVSPHLSLISCGRRNPFHHPSALTIDLLNQIEGNKVLRTDEEGAITIHSDGTRILLD